MTAWQGIGDSGVEITYEAPPGVRAVLAALGRTEDIRFSPGNRRLAIAAFNRHRVAVFDVDVADGRIALTRAVELCSPHLKRPHGLDFIDDDTLIVANREGGVCVFRLPSQEAHAAICEVVPIQMTQGLESPGSVWVDHASGEVLICNNASSCVTRHIVQREEDGALRGHQVLLRKWLDVPDGITVSHDRRWLAVSNHNTHNVLIYERRDGLGPESDPDCILRGAHYPHGLRFSADDRFLILADAAAPYIHVYARDGEGWRGVRNPVATVRVMDDDLFQRGRNNPQEGGPKGVDLDRSGSVLAVTSECQPLAFFRLPALLEAAEIGSQATAFATRADVTDGADPRRDPQLLAHYRRERDAMQIRYELESMERARAARDRLERSLAKARAKLAATRNTLSWRLTKPLRRIASALRRQE